MWYIIEYNRVKKKKCRLDNIKELTRIFELWVSQKQLQDTLKYTRSGVFTAI